MDISIQLNNIREQFKKIENQIFITQSQNMGGLASIKSPIFNMAIQMFNMGIQMINIGTQIPSMGMDMINYKSQIQNLGFQIQNLGNQMNNIMSMNNNMLNMGIMEIQNNNMIMHNNFSNNNMDWKKGYETGMKSTATKKQNVIFHLLNGTRRGMSFDYGTTIGDALKKYLIENNGLELIKTNKISFLYNAQKISLDDKTKIEKFFLGNPIPTITILH